MCPLLPETLIPLKNGAAPFRRKCRQCASGASISVYEFNENGARGEYLGGLMFALKNKIVLHGHTKI